MGIWPARADWLQESAAPMRTLSVPVSTVSPMSKNLAPASVRFTSRLTGTVDASPRRRFQKEDLLQMLTPAAAKTDRSSSTQAIDISSPIHLKFFCANSTIVFLLFYRHCPPIAGLSTMITLIICMEWSVYLVVTCLDAFGSRVERCLAYLVQHEIL